MKVHIISGLFAVAALSVNAASTSSSNNLIVVGDQSKASASLYSLDFQSDGTATALELRMNVEASEKVKIDTSNCVKRLPKSHSGSCIFNGKELVVLVYSERNSLLPTGLIDLGTVKIFGLRNNKAVTVGTFIAGSPDGQAVNASASVE